uniref:Intraflagellar transport protein 56 n=1 Tax=Ditylenchus dipsaci TaxID=166011 RepID=A0A915CTY8_9BILA
MAMYEDARKAADKGPKNALQNRLLFHVAHKLNDEKKLMLQHSQLKDTIEDQLCLASIHYLRSHYQQAIDIYKKVLSKHKNYLALNVYLGLCYYKLDYYDVSMEVVQTYLDHHPDSPIAINLKACNHYRLYNSKAAEGELKEALKHLSHSELNFAKDILLHNTVVFRNGDAALQMLPTLVDVIPEARLNLVIYHLKKNDTDAAFLLMNHMEPQSTQDFMLKGITYCLKGTEDDSKEHLKAAAQFFKAVESPLRSVIRLLVDSAWLQPTSFANNMMKYWFRRSLAKTMFSTSTWDRPKLCASSMRKQSKVWRMWPAATPLRPPSLLFVFGKGLYSQWKGQTSLECLPTPSAQFPCLLRLVANDCYRMEEYVYAAKAFEELEKRAESSRAYHNTAKRAACVGVFKLFTVNKATTDDLREAMNMLKQDPNPLTQNVASVARKWAAEANVISSQPFASVY